MIRSFSIMPVSIKKSKVRSTLAVVIGISLLVLTVIILSIPHFFSYVSASLISDESLWGFSLSRPLPVVTMISDKREPISWQDLRQQPTVVSFIFTRCRNICPLTVQRYQKIQSLADNDKMMQFVFITLDPEFDTPERLHDFVSPLGEHYLGVHVEKLPVLLNAFRQPLTGLSPNVDALDISHTGAIYLFHPARQDILVYPSGSVEAVVRDVSLLGKNRT
ncbi:SCO family protein [Marinibactrum halimedae]|uniref:SCO family protein n=1 Tax=Marinibactrum halimedae TaxID=1444977 RepID=A0AA37T269_9GAMM|nr:SCO family protein [Marinibactrum halimedae]MCD9457658.1 SCO family protein [Marinibactrum halimedae]GLS24968.1 hypothetical protein GCM10007877_06820 [Marinibactrum halimedae]